MNRYIVLLSSFIVLFFIMTSILMYTTSLQKEKESLYEHDKKNFNNLVDAQSKNITILADSLASNPVVIKAYKKNNPQLLIQHVNPIWKKVKEKKLIHEIHFFQPPAISFVNFSNFKSI